jgi:TrpR family trp operon transcriptional repressor
MKTTRSLDPAWQGFLQSCLENKSIEALEEFLDLFLTHEEKHDFARRHLIVKALLKGDKTQRQIAKELHVSIANVTRGSNCLKQTSEELKRFLK